MKYASALCLYPYFRESSAAMGFFPPTGLEYVSAALEGLVGQLTLMDLRQEKEYRDIEALTRFVRKDIDLMCVSVNWSFYFEEVCSLIDCFPDDVMLVIGGQHATDHVDELFEKCPSIDIIVRGEGEETIQEIAQDVDRDDILGISHKKNGRIVHNPNRPLPPVDRLRYPDRKLRRTSYAVKSKGIKLLSGGFDTVLSARGCPFNCKFCTSKLNPLGQKRSYSARTPESVIEEIRTLKAEIIYFVDDNFFVNPERVENICDLLIKQGINKKFIAQARLEIYKYPDMLRKAEKAGFKVMLIGIESPHDRTLKQLNKGFTSNEVRNGFEVLRDYSFYYHCYFIYGNIGETREEMLHIPLFAKEIGADSISFQKLQVRKFSSMREIVERAPGYYISSKGFVYSNRYNRDDLNRIGKEIRRLFYTPRQLRRILVKLFKIRLVTLEDFFAFALRLPSLLYRITTREAYKRRRKTRRLKAAMGI